MTHNKKMNERIPLLEEGDEVVVLENAMVARRGEPLAPALSELRGSVAEIWMHVRLKEVPRQHLGAHITLILEDELMVSANGVLVPPTLEFDA